ncbi:MAG: hypothetical protein JKY80_04635, partial [Mariprofundaceae bacterium]|nr:hypothetical protein [Mariprofundaceae bacterium]
MSQESRSIQCPKCGEDIDVNDLLYQQVNAQLEKKFQDDLAQEKQRFEAQSSKLEEERRILAEDKRQQADAIEKKVLEAIKKKEVDLKKKIKAEAEDEQAGALGALREELQEKSDKVKLLNQTTVELERLKREKDGLE